MPARFAAIEKKLRAACLAYPEAVEEFPWDERVFKVRKKIFAMPHEYEGVLYVTCKLPESGSMALSFDFASPTGYGLGKSGWVTAAFKRGDDVPIDLMLEWIDESYRAVAPKKLVTALGPSSAAAGGGAAPAARARRAQKPASPRRGSGSGRGSARAPASRKSKRSGGGSARS